MSRNRGVRRQVAQFVRRFHNIFYSLRSASKLIWKYGSSSLHIRVFWYIRIIRFMFASKYLHRSAYKYSIWCKKNTWCREYLLQGEHSLKIFSYWRIFASKYSLIIVSASVFVRFACKISRFASMRNKRVRPVSFASKRINICFIFANIRFEANITAHPTLQRQFRLYIPFLGIARPQPQFPYSCVCERFIYSQDRSSSSRKGRTTVGIYLFTIFGILSLQCIGPWL